MQNRLRADKNESRSLSAVDTQGHQRGGFCIRRSISSSSSLSFNCALRESGCRIGYGPTRMSRDHFRRSIPRDTNVEVSALSPSSLMKSRVSVYCMPKTVLRMISTEGRFFESVKLLAHQTVSWSFLTI